MTGDAMKARLAGHLAQPDLSADVTARLPARRIDRYEAMHLETVACGALDLTQRAGIGFEMHAVPGGRRDPLPLLVFLVSLDVTSGADPRRDFGMHLNLLGTIGHPEVELPRARENRLLVAVVTAEGIVLGAG